MNDEESKMDPDHVLPENRSRATPGEFVVVCCCCCCCLMVVMRRLHLSHHKVIPSRNSRERFDGILYPPSLTLSL